ncbi:hypothetical protein CFI00_08095 [Nocardioides sp. S5]|uniref:hypothetical protein n=1 Tax=Nocardioides sp. S5 TaxID=2017486 RepID=UPI001A900B8A|nr:hypothetical protein [Nocardioides sp. S5]QSR30465.1 hypothetical protein CFI00_08095 [Nocardioides sp. S5]
MSDRTEGNKAMAASRTTGLLAAAIALALAAGLGATVPAHSSSTTKKDPKDDVFLGSLGGGIDLAAVQLATLNRKKRIRVTFGLHSPVQQGSLEKPGGMSVQFIKNTRVWRVVEVVREDGGLRGEVCSHSRGPEVTDPYDCSALPVTRVDARTYRAVVELDQVRKGAKVLRWTARTMDLTSGSPVSDSMTAENREPFRWRL